MHPSNLFHPLLAGLSVALLLAVTACSSEPGAVYVDKWKLVGHDGPERVTIERNNDNFRVDKDNDDDPWEMTGTARVQNELQNLPVEFMLERE